MRFRALWLSALSIGTFATAATAQTPRSTVLQAPIVRPIGVEPVAAVTGSSPGTGAVTTVLAVGTTNIALGNATNVQFGDPTVPNVVVTVPQPSSNGSSVNHGQRNTPGTITVAFASNDQLTNSITRGQSCNQGLGWATCSVTLTVMSSGTAIATYQLKGVSFASQGPGVTAFSYKTLAFAVPVSQTAGGQTAGNGTSGNATGGTGNNTPNNGSNQPASGSNNGGSSAGTGTFSVAMSSANGGNSVSFGNGTTATFSDKAVPNLTVPQSATAQTSGQRSVAGTLAVTFATNDQLLSNASRAQICDGIMIQCKLTVTVPGGANGAAKAMYQLTNVSFTRTGNTQTVTFAYLAIQYTFAAAPPNNAGNNPPSGNTGNNAPNNGSNQPANGSNNGSNQPGNKTGNNTPSGNTGNPAQGNTPNSGKSTASNSSIAVSFAAGPASVALGNATAALFSDNAVPAVTTAQALTATAKPTSGSRNVAGNVVVTFAAGDQQLANLSRAQLCNGGLQVASCQLSLKVTGTAGQSTYTLTHVKFGPTTGTPATVTFAYQQIQYALP
jgi:hypothetical protein